MNMNKEGLTRDNKTGEVPCRECIAYSVMGHPSASGFSCPEVHIFSLLGPVEGLWECIAWCLGLVIDANVSSKSEGLVPRHALCNQCKELVLTDPEVSLNIHRHELISRPNASGLAGTKHSFHQDNAAVEVVDR